MEILADISLYAIAIVGALSLVTVAVSALKSWRCRDKSDYVEMNIPRHRIGVGVTLLLIAFMAITYFLEKCDLVDMIIDTMGLMFLAAIVAALYGWTRLLCRRKKGMLL